MTDQKATNIHWHAGAISRLDRERVAGHKGVTVWFTGLSGSGKSTVARRVEELLFERGVRTYVLDGDNIRFGLNKDLGFSPQDREQNIRRIGEVAKLFTDFGAVTLTAFISPYRKDRDQVRALLGAGEFLEVYVACALDRCEERDTKGLYKKARAGEIKEFTGISAPYEEPTKPEIVLQTDAETVDESAMRVVEYLERCGYVRIGSSDSAPTSGVAPPKGARA